MSQKRHGNGNKRSGRSIEEQLTEAFGSLINVEKAADANLSQNVPGYKSSFNRRSNSRTESGYKVSVESKSSARPNKGGSVNSSIKEKTMEHVKAQTTGTTSELPGGINTEEIAAAAPTKVDAANEAARQAAAAAMAKGIEEGRRQAQAETIQKQASELKQEAKGFFGMMMAGLRQHMQNNRGKYGVALGALAAVGGEAAYASYRARKGDQMTYLRQAEPGGVYTVGGDTGDAGAAPAGAGAGAGGNAGGRGR